jgi:hypothetical protein
MPDMHRPGRIGRDVFDIDLLGRTDVAAAISLVLTQHGAQRVGPDRRLQGKIDEAGSGDIDRGNQIIRAQFGGDLFGEVARLGFRLFGQHHRSIGRHVAMGGVARRLYHDARQIDAGGPAVFGCQRVAHRVHARQHIGEKMRR